MRQGSERSAAAVRDDGLRRISRLTWRAGAAGVICSAVIAAAFGHHVKSTSPATSRPSQGSILIPAQPPAAGSGSGQVTSGAS
ncbi:MAG TPA: hypothetical protein VGI64_13015 [Streptosporangiaceae bacterium]|jgi:hypothetical protein